MAETVTHTPHCAQHFQTQVCPLAHFYMPKCGMNGDALLFFAILLLQLTGNPSSLYTIELINAQHCFYLNVCVLLSM